MKKIVADAARLLQIPGSDFRSGKNNDIYVTSPSGRFDEFVKEMASDFDLVALFCAEGFGAHAGFTLFYAFERPGDPDVLVLERPLGGKRATSIAATFASACWYEREISDGFGIEFTSAFDRRRLFLHEPYPLDFHPLRKTFRNQPVKTRQAIPPEAEYRFNNIEGEGVYQIPVGPVHAGIIEPGHFRFSVIGETIFNLEVRMFYKHRGVEKLAEGKRPEDCLSIAESISGDESAANATAFCIAIENILGINVPLRAWQLRTVALEMERIYSHLGDLAGMITDVAYPVGAAGFFMLREEMLRQNAELTGSRFLKNALSVGGLKADFSDSVLAGLAIYLKDFLRKLDDALKLVHRSAWVIDRLETTGVVRKELVRPLHLTGPTARASGVRIDTRTDHPYGIYSQLPLKKTVMDKGDVECRFDLKAEEIRESVEIILRLLGELKPGEVSARGKTSDRPALSGVEGHALAIVEAPRGQSMHWVAIKNGVIDRYKVRTASFCNWRAIEHAVFGNIVPDFPLINKSLNLSYAGTDL